MANETEINEALIELFAVANAPLTPPQRVQRAKAVFESLSMSMPELIDTLKRQDLRWNMDRARALGVSDERWQEALTAAGIDNVTDLSGLLDAMHRAEAASAMLRAGYAAGKDPAGKLSWTK